jgi:hypothetical protein
MSMNFAREQSLLRQRLQAKSTPAQASERTAQHGTGLTFLGAAEPELAAAAVDLANAWPQMGRAQMTAFVRTLWNSKIHELRDVGTRLLAARASLLEPHDLPLLEGFLGDDVTDAVLARLARDVLGAIVLRHKKVWRELKRLAAGSDAGRRAAVRATQLSLAAEAEAFARFEELALPLLPHADAALQQAIDEALTAAATLALEPVKVWAAQHGRTLKMPPKAVKPKVAASAKAEAKPIAAKTPPPRPAAAAPATGTPAARPKPAAAKSSPAKAPKPARPTAAKSPAPKPAERRGKAAAATGKAK